MRLFAMNLRKRTGITRYVARRKRDARKPRRQHTHLLGVESLEDRFLLSVFTVNSTGDAGSMDSGSSHTGNSVVVEGQFVPEVTLRSAIEAANATTELDTIEFAVPPNDPGHFYYQNNEEAGSVSLDNVARMPEDGSAPLFDPDHPHSWFRIQPMSPLPTITHPVIIDGYKQPGASPNTNLFGQALNTVLKIELDGSEASKASLNPIDGLIIRAGGSIVRGLAINQWGLPTRPLNDSGIRLIDAGGNRVQGNFFGTDVSGTIAPSRLPDYATGMGVATWVNVWVFSPNNWIGMDEDQDESEVVKAGERNLVAAAGCGIAAQSWYNVVAGNLVGTDISGTKALGNYLGISHNGHYGRSERNVASGNAAGILLTGGGPSYDILVSRNYVGTDATGKKPLGNLAVGVFSGFGSQSSVIGGASAAESNIIAYNHGPGVWISPVRQGGQDYTAGIRIQGNSIHSNDGLGIDLGGNFPFPGPDGWTENDGGDTDAGPNNFQNAPVMTMVETGATTRVVGALDSLANTEFTLDFYANTGTSPYGIGEGERWLEAVTASGGPLTVTTDEFGHADFDFVLPIATNADDEITATATAPDGSTSEFSYVAERFTVINTHDSGLGSLRTAITGANYMPGATIEFAIPRENPDDAPIFLDVDSALPGGDQDEDVFIIQLESPLPALTRDETTIDARTQKNFGSDTNSFGPEIVLDGSAIGADSQPVPASVFIAPEYGGLSGSEKILIHSGDLYVVSHDNDTIMRYDASTGVAKPSEGNEGAVFAQGLMDKPIGFDFGPDGNLYVANHGTDAASPAADTIVCFDGTTGQLLGTFVASGSGGLLGATGLAFGPDGNLYVSSYHNDMVMRYDGQTGSPMPSVGNVGAVFASGGELDGPQGLTFGPDGNVYVVSQLNQQVVRYEGTSGAALGVFVSAGSGLNGPLDLHFDSAGNLLVTAAFRFYTSRVQRYQGPGGPEPGAYLGLAVPSQPELAEPSGLAIGPDDSLYVTSRSQSSVLRTTVPGSAAPWSEGVQILSNNNQVYGLNIQGFSGDGIQINGGSNNVVAGCFVGTDATGTSDSGNGQHGVRIVGEAGSNQIGGPGDLANTIAFNGLSGVAVLSSAATGNRIQGNSIHSNVGLGIDLGGDGFTENDDGDGDTGPNNLQNHPLITSVTVGGGSTTIKGTLNAAPKTTYSLFTLDFFTNAIANVRGYDEGERYLGSHDLVNVTTDRNGDVEFTATFQQLVPDTEAITATATNPDGDTSEFSAPKRGVGIGTGVLYVLGTDTDDVVTLSLENGVYLKIAASFLDTVQYFDAAEVTAIEIHLHHGNDRLETLEPEAFSIPVWVDGGTGDDYLQTGSGDDSLLGGRGEDELWAGAGNDSLDGGDGDDQLHDGPGNDTLVGGLGDDTLYIGPGTDEVDGGGGSDTYIYVSGSSSWTRIFDTGTSGMDTLVVYGTSGDDTLSITAAAVSAIQPKHPVYYAQMESVRVDAGDGNDLITIDGSQTPVTVLAGAGDDTVVVQGNGSDGLLLDGEEGSDTYSIYFGNLLGSVAVSDSGTIGSDALMVHGTAGDDLLTLDAETVTGDGQTIIFSATVESISIDTGDGDDQLSVASAPVVPLVVWGNSAAVVQGTDGPDQILFTPGSPSEIVASLNGVSLGTFVAPTKLVAYGRGGDDNIQVAGSIAVAAWLYGGTGNDRLKGGGGHDVLVGDGGDDLLVGGSGRDLLIGGVGADRIVGNADDDILIAGSTLFDANDTALCAIMAEWTSDHLYDERIANLWGSSEGREDAFELRHNGEYFLKTSGDEPTVSDDDARDVLTGSAGLDWFIFNDTEDKVTDLSDEEFADVLDFVLAVL